MGLNEIDRWKPLRKNLFQNVEVSCSLRGSTFLFDTEDEYRNSIFSVSNDEDSFGYAAVAPIHPNRIPGYLARKCYASEPSPEGDVRLTSSLLRSKPKAHTVPFEFMTWIFEVDGISKSSLTQMDRHRMASFLQQSGRWMDRSNVQFVYDAYDDVDDEELVRTWYAEDEIEKKRTLALYDARKQRVYLKNGEEKKFSRQSARRNLTVDFATGTMLAINTLSLRNLLELRLDSHAEWEIRRVARLMWDKVVSIAPSQFEQMILPSELTDIPFTDKLGKEGLV